MTEDYKGSQRCKEEGHSYAVFHYFTGGKKDDITCCRCGEPLVWDEKLEWWVTKTND